MRDKVFVTAYVSFWSRVKKEVMMATIISALAMLGCYLALDGDFRFFGIGVVGIIGIIYVLGALEDARVFVNELIIADGKVILRGYNYNTPSVEQFDLLDSDMKITVLKEGMGTMGCSLKIVSGSKAVNIDGVWNYRTQSEIFRAFKREKGEKITAQEAYFLNKMDKSDNVPAL